MDYFTISGQIVDIYQRQIYPGEVTVSSGRILSIQKVDSPSSPFFIMPGFVDAHIHIESSMLVPSEFARIAVRHGTVGTVSDPHEIGNVLGILGVEFMILNGKTVPFKFYFGAPSCVPATMFETAGAIIDQNDIIELLNRPDIKYLSEMMNWPAVLHRDKLVMDKIIAAQNADKPIDGHAPGLRGEDAQRYAAAGISTDHECTTLEEALDKLAAGMKIIIREGSAARNFEALIPLMRDYSDRLMFCSDDKHPDELLTGHINQLVRKSVKSGYSLFDVLQAACINPIKHYNLDIGTLLPGDAADFILVRNLQDFDIMATYIGGQKVYDVSEGPCFSAQPCSPINQFECLPISPAQISARIPGDEFRIIVAHDGEIHTSSLWCKITRNQQGEIIASPREDILKMVVVNRYQNAPPAVAFIRGFGLQHGAIASTIAHDSHNIIAVGTDDDLIVRAINLLIEHQGGICSVNHQEELVLPLPVAGLMSTLPGEEIALRYQQLDQAAKAMGSGLRAPFMTLSFMALLVIPELKLSDKGLFDGTRFEFVNLARK